MGFPISRRAVLGLIPALGLARPRTARADAPGQAAAMAPEAGFRPVHASFPSHPPELVREVVTVAHFDAGRVRELVEARPALARAAWDWGFGDWETPLGAASHMGRREIAEYLLERGARPTIFSAAMLGQLEVVRAFVSASSGVQGVRGPHGLTLLAHARAGGEAAAPVVAYLESIGGADPQYPLVPLDETARAAIEGRYDFGAGPSDGFEVTVDRRGNLTIERPGGTARALFHLGDRTFFPAGADAVRIRFEGDGARPDRLTVQDADQILTATRTGSG